MCLYMLRSVNSVLLCCSMYCLCVTVYCTSATGFNTIAVNKYSVPSKFHLTPNDALVSCLKNNIKTYIKFLGPGSSVSIMTEYDLDGRGSNSGEDEIFHPSRPALGPTQPPVLRVPGLSLGCVEGVLLTIHPLLLARALWATPDL